MEVVRCCRVVLGVAMLVASASPGTAQVSNTAQAEQQALAAIVQELDTAWNARDPARFSAVFTEDGSFQFPVEGIALRGRDEIRRHYATEFKTFPPDLRHVTTTGKRMSSLLASSQ